MVVEVEGKVVLTLVAQCKLSYWLFFRLRHKLGLLNFCQCKPVLLIEIRKSKSAVSYEVISF